MRFIYFGDMDLLQITFDTTININTPIMVGAFSAIGVAMKNHWHKVNRMHTLTRIQLESIIYAQYVSRNEQDGEAWRKAYNEKRIELMKEYNFVEDK